MLKTVSKFIVITFVLLFSIQIEAQLPNDCVNAVTVCGDSDVVLDVSGTGTTGEFPDSCQSNENNSLWLEVTVITDGTLAFTLTPNSASINEDYDFFIFGPNTSCNNLGPTIRCSTTNPSASGQSDNLTGLNPTETDNFEGPGPAGNSFVSAINALAGDTYFIVIDRPVGNSPFSLTWTGTAQFADAPTSDSSNNGQVLDLTDCDSLAPFNDGETPFNLEVNTPLIIGPQTDVAVAYYETESDANSSVNSLTSPYISTGDGQTIYATITNTITGCFTIQEFQLFVTSQPTINTPPTIEVCDDTANDGVEQFDLSAQNATVLGTQNASNFNITYHLSQTDADSGLNSLASNYTNVSNPQTIFVRMESITNTDCFSTTTFDLIVNSTPTINTISNYELCDDDTDGFTVFDLTIINTNIINGQTNVTVSYFESQNDANNNSNPIPDPSSYTNNTINTQTIYARLSNSNANCFSTTGFNIIVNPLPVITTLPDYEICDNENDGDDTNGFVVFDLNTQDAQLINGQNVIISYFESQADADNNINNIPNPATYTNNVANNQTIYYRLENTTSMCEETGTFNLVVNELPQIQNSILVQCDEDGVPDGFTVYNLNEANENIMINGNTNGFNYTHHINLTDAQNGINPLNPFPYTNTTNPQTIYVRIEDETTGCFKTAEYLLEVTATDIGNAGLSACDDNDDGFFEFTLSDADTDILAALPPGLTVAYYATANDAQLEINQLPNNYTNTTPFFQTLFLRVENANDCFGIATMTLEVNPLPQSNPVNNIIICTDTPNTPAIDLTQFNSQVLGNQNAMDFTITYHETQIDADTGNSALTSPYNNQSNPQTLYVRVENNMTGCFIASINFELLIVDSNPVITANVTTPAFADQHNIQVTVNTASANGIIYEYSLDGGPWQVNDSDSFSYTFTNVTPGEHTIRVRDIYGCYEDSVTVLVIDYPLYFTPNGDNFNNFWNIYSLDTQLDALISIYDRYGKLLKQLSPGGNGWDGTYNGKPMPTSDYWFTVEYREPNTDVKTSYNAHFTLKR